MKKCIVSIFAVFYLGLSCGFAFNMHFCMGRLSSVELFHTGSDKCGKCGMKNREGCCNSKLTVIKITDCQQSSTAHLNINPPFTAIVNHHAFANLQPVINSLLITFTDTSPPAVSGAFICVMNSIFTI
ncbi:MAG: hypothetical protein ABI416_08170 [Ginsengibacter sp.]